MNDDWSLKRKREYFRNTRKYYYTVEDIDKLREKLIEDIQNTTNWEAWTGYREPDGPFFCEDIAKENIIKLINKRFGV